MFKYRDLVGNPIPKVQIRVESKFVQNLVGVLEKRTGVKCYVVGGAIRQLVREVWWGRNLDVLRGNLGEYIMQNSRDFDILFEGKEFCKSGDDRFKELTRLVMDIGLIYGYMEIEEKMIDLIQIPNYFDDIDLASNAVLYDGKVLTFLSLFEGEDYINLNNPNLNKTSDKRMRLRWLINHSHCRPGNKIWFVSEKEKEVNKELEQYENYFYYTTYKDKIRQLKEMYGTQE
jgi:hypothetical protein